MAHYAPNAAGSMSSTSLMPAGVDTDSSTMRPRNRRGPPTQQMTQDSAASQPTSRGVSPIPSRLASRDASRSRSSGGTFGRNLLEGSWASNWASVQDFANSFIVGEGYSSEPDQPNSRNEHKSRPLWKGLGGGSAATNRGRLPDAWGPPPPPRSRPTGNDIATGSLKERDAQLMARKRASVLQSHEGINGGLDVSGKYKRRNSDECEPDSFVEQPVEDHLVYLHHVQPTDTYAGMILRYRCQDHAFRKSNGLWTQNIQMRKYLLIPVDACEIKGRPCDPPSYLSPQIDLLATTPGTPSVKGNSSQPQSDVHDEYFSPLNGQSGSQLAEQDAGPLWTHVKWVKLDSSQIPIEIVRVSRRAMGYFPHRRRSMATISAVSTPRHSLDLSKSASQATDGSPKHVSSRRQSSLSGRPASGSFSRPSLVRGRGSSEGEVNGMPPWMQRPGGVGSMGRAVKAPGPAQDGLNSWVNKTLPKGFNIDSLPSMSVMGSESAHFGFKREDGSGIVESSYEEGRDTESTARGNAGRGLEQAASSIETWVRSAWAKRPGTPRLGSQKRPAEELDFIEMADTNSDDGRSGVLGGGDNTLPSMGLPEQSRLSSSGRSDGEGVVRSRTTTMGSTGSGSKGKKAD